MPNARINDNSPFSNGHGTHTHDYSRCPGDGNYEHGAGDKSIRRKLTAVFFLTAFYTAAEAVGGWLTGSLALLADAGHMAVDALALGIALAASQLAKRPATKEKTFGFFRVETLAAFINAATLIVIAGSIFFEAGKRLFDPVPVESGAMTLVAAGGLLVNLLSIKILHGHHDHDLNSRGAWLHILGDTLGSVGAIAAGLFIWLTGRSEADSVISFAIGGFVIYTSWSLIKKAAHILLEGAPEHLNYSEVERSILSTEGVRAVHDLHLWQISSGRVALICHIVCAETYAPWVLLDRVSEMLRGEFGIEHLTLQIETDRAPERGTNLFCRTADHGCYSPVLHQP